MIDQKTVAGVSDSLAHVSGPGDVGESIARSANGMSDWRTALHEAGHCCAGKVGGLEVAGCAIFAGGGLTWGSKHVRSELSDDERAVPIFYEQSGPDLHARLAEFMPHDGESRGDAFPIFAHVHVRLVELAGGTAAETVLHSEDEPWIAHSDIRQARSLAAIICTSEAAIDAYLEFALVEAKALISKHRETVLALANALMIERTLDAERIDSIIDAAVLAKAIEDERQRRLNWQRVKESAARFRADHQERRDAR
jgi:hypothetical protein